MPSDPELSLDAYLLGEWQFYCIPWVLFVRLSFVFIFNQAFIDLMTKGFPEKFDSQSNQLLTPIKTFVLRLLAIKIIEKNERNPYLVFLFSIRYTEIEWWYWVLQKDGKPFSTSLTMADRKLVVPHSTVIWNWQYDLEIRRHIIFYGKNWIAKSFQFAI